MESTAPCLRTESSVVTNGMLGRVRKDIEVVQEEGERGEYHAQVYARALGGGCMYVGSFLGDVCMRMSVSGVCACGWGVPGVEYMQNVAWGWGCCGR